jgi:hypothetical protein
MQAEMIALDLPCCRVCKIHCPSDLVLLKGELIVVGTAMENTSVLADNDSGLIWVLKELARAASYHLRS